MNWEGRSLSGLFRMGANRHMKGDIELVTAGRDQSEQPFRVPKTTLIAWKIELSEWTPTNALRARIDQITQSIPRTTLFSQGGLAFLRDTWIASRVASALQADTVRLISAERPDFEIQTGGNIQGFEATEADMDGRRRGDEPDNPPLQQDPVEAWRNRFEAIPAALDRVVSKKLSKEYPPETNLVIYLNLGCYGAYVQEGLPILRHHTAPAAAKFRRVFVLWEGYLYRFWEEGQYRFEKWQYAQLEDF